MVRRQLEKLLGKEDAARIVNIPLHKISPNPFQPRRDYPEHEMVELAQSIRSYGVIQPVIVRARENGYQLVAGERRFRACCLLGFNEIPALIQDLDDERAAAIALVENIQRQELNYMEEALAYQKLIQNIGFTQEELAKKIGRSQSAIANKLRLLKLPERVKNMIEPDRISERHARALLRLNSVDVQIEVLKRIYEQELTVRETDALVDKLSRQNIPQEIRSKNGGPNVSLIIRDTRIFLNTIKETVRRARQTGVDILFQEHDSEQEYEIVIRVNKDSGVHYAVR